MDRKAKSGGKVLRHLNFQAADLGSTRQPQADRLFYEEPGNKRVALNLCGLNNMGLAALSCLL